MGQRGQVVVHLSNNHRPYQTHDHDRRDQDCSIGQAVRIKSGLSDTVVSFGLIIDGMGLKIEI